MVGLRRGPLSAHYCFPPSLFRPECPACPSSLGELLRRMRMDLGLTMKQVAEGFGVCYEAVVNWEVHGCQPYVTRRVVTGDEPCAGQAGKGT